MKLQGQVTVLPDPATAVRAALEFWKTVTSSGETQSRESIPVLAVPGPVAEESPVFFTTMSWPCELEFMLAPVFALPPPSEVAIPVFDTRTLLPPVPVVAAQTATPIAATAAIADTEVAILFAWSHCRTASTSASPVTIKQVATSAVRPTLIALIR